MVRVCKLSEYAARFLSPNERSGWPDGVAYNPTSKRKRRKKRKQYSPSPLPIALAIRVDSTGDSLL